MRRGHTAADYLRRIETIKNARRQIAITSDIIIGFPGETDADFRDTMTLVERSDITDFTSSVFGRQALRRTLVTTKYEPEEGIDFRVGNTHAIIRRRFIKASGRKVKCWRTRLAQIQRRQLRPSTFPSLELSQNSVKLGEVVTVRVNDVKPNSLYGETMAA